MPAPVVPRDDDPSSPILMLDSFPVTGTPQHPKKSGYELFAMMKSPRHIVAPMVDQSELPWRILSRRYDSHLVYTPMINSRQFANKVKVKGPHHHTEFWLSESSEGQKEGQEQFKSHSGEEIGSDRPLIVQFAGHEPDILLAAAQTVEEHCDAVDLNLGCPQDIARRGHYGSFLQSDWHLIFRLINTLHINLRVPVTAKMRVFESTERTVAYALMMERAGAQIITVHGRTREMKGHKTGLADWKKIKAVKEAVKVPVFANGNILFREDVESAIKATGADGVMSAEGNLYNPAMFAEPPKEATDLYPLAPIYPFPRLTMLIAEYLDICDNLIIPTRPSAIKGHIFRLARPALEVHRDLRPMLGQCTVVISAKGKERHSQFHGFLSHLSKLLEKDEEEEKYKSQLVNNPIHFESKPGEDSIYIPHWLAQPYYRTQTMPPADEREEDKRARLEKRKMRVDQTEGLVGIDDVQTKGEDAMKEGEKADKRLRTLMEEAKTIKANANALFEKQQYDDAINEYVKVLDVLPARKRDFKEFDDDEESKRVAEASEEEKGKGRESVEEVDKEEVAIVEDQVESTEEEEIRILRAVIFANLAACHLKKINYKEAVVACNESLLDDPLYLKALHRRAQANEEINTWSSLTSSLEDYKTINGMPHPVSLQTSLDAALKRLPAKIITTSEKEKEEMVGKLKGLGDSVLGYFGLSTNNFQFQKGEGGGYNLNFVR